jgi:hypothetical protein
MLWINHMLLLLRYGFTVDTEILPNWFCLQFAVCLFVYMVGLVEFG